MFILGLICGIIIGVAGTIGVLMANLFKVFKGGM